MSDITLIIGVITGILTALLNLLAGSYMYKYNLYRCLK